MSLKNILTEKIKIYRGIAIPSSKEDIDKEEKQFDKENVGISWSLFDNYAYNRAEEMSLLFKHKHFHKLRELVLEAEIDLDKVDWEYTLGQYTDKDYWHQEYEVVLNSNEDIKFRIIYDSEDLENSSILHSGNTGEGNYDETMISVDENSSEFKKLKLQYLKEL